jgi:ParB-like chromosome segregation protein Spo0J
MKIRDRIKELRRVKASELHPNPKNWRTHPKQQLDAIRGILAEVGFAGAELARELPDGSLQLIDGHARAEIAGDAEIPVLVLDVTESEADKILATYDPIGAMAEADAVRLEELLRDVQTGNEALADMLAELAEQNDLFDVDATEPPELADGDREPFRQMTFTVHDSQFEVIEAALKKAKANGGGESVVNENSNGNALAFVCEAFNG